MRLRSLDSGRLFSAKIAFRIKPLAHLYTGDFAEPFSPPLRASLRARRSSLRRAPQGPARPLTRGRANPAPDRLRLLWRSRSNASRADLQQKKYRIFVIFPSRRRGKLARRFLPRPGGRSRWCSSAPSARTGSRNRPAPRTSARTPPERRRPPPSPRTG